MARKHLEEDDVRRLIARDAEGRGIAIATWAKEKDLSQAYVAHFLQGRQGPGPKLLEALGLKRIVTYVSAE